MGFQGLCCINSPGHLVNLMFYIDISDIGEYANIQIAFNGQHVIYIQRRRPLSIIEGKRQLFITVKLIIYDFRKTGRPK